MGDQPNGNGMVAQALVKELKEELKEHRREVMAILQPLIKQVAGHEQMCEGHCRELFNSKGSRIREVELGLEAQVQALHLHERAASEEAKTSVSRKWAVKVIFITALVTVATSLTSQYLITRLLP